MTGETALLFVPIGDNPARPFGMSARERASRLAQNAGFTIADAAEPSRGALLASMAYCWDPAWLSILKDRPKSVLTFEGKPVIVNLPEGSDGDAATRALENGDPLEGFEPLSDRGAPKGKRPFVMPLDPDDPAPVERAIYDAAYKQVSDVITLHLLRGPLFTLTRAAGRAGLTAIALTLLGGVFCLLAFFLFWRGNYWPGILAGFSFIIVDTLQAQLARCTGSSSKWGDILSQGIAVVFAPFWWWAWLHGLEAYGHALEPVYATMILIVILGGYLGDLFIEFVSIHRFGGLDIHRWRPLDSKFRLISSGPNINLAILTGALLLGRPDNGLVLVAWWSLISLIFHAVRFAQMTERKARGEPIKSWLDA